MGKTIAIIGDDPFAVEEVGDSPELKKIKFLEDRIHEIKGEINFLLSKSSPVESPIEEIMYRELLKIKYSVENILLEMQVTPQAEIYDYRVDFFVKTIHKTPKYNKKFVIECDGHEWHEKTKEQAAKDKKRDRDIVMKCGYPVIRFTGSEIVNNIAACIDEIVQYII